MALQNIRKVIKTGFNTVIWEDFVSEFHLFQNSSTRQQYPQIYEIAESIYNVGTGARSYDHINKPMHLSTDLCRSMKYLICKTVLTPEQMSQAKFLIGTFLLYQSTTETSINLRIVRMLIKKLYNIRVL